MEKEIEEIRTKIEQFMEKYNCLVTVETTSYGYTVEGKLAQARTRLIINS